MYVFLDNDKKNKWCQNIYVFVEIFKSNECGLLLIFLVRNAILPLLKLLLIKLCSTHLSNKLNT